MLRFFPLGLISFQGITKADEAAGEQEQGAGKKSVSQNHGTSVMKNPSFDAGTIDLTDSKSIGAARWFLNTALLSLHSMNEPYGGILPHPTILSCLEALQWLAERGRFATILDMGCGSGILSLAAAKMWDATVLGADISPQAIADTIGHAKAYGLESRITTVRSDLFSDSHIKTRAPYELIIFNLLAEPITRTALEVKAHLTAGGVVVLSGLLEWLAGDVEAAYQNLGFTTIHIIRSSPWVTHIMKAGNR